MRLLFFSAILCLSAQPMTAFAETFKTMEWRVADSSGMTAHEERKQRILERRKAYEERLKARRAPHSRSASGDGGNAVSSEDMNDMQLKMLKRKQEQAERRAEYFKKLQDKMQGNSSSDDTVTNTATTDQTTGSQEPATTTEDTSGESAEDQAIFSKIEDAMTAVQASGDALEDAFDRFDNGAFDGNEDKAEKILDEAEKLQDDAEDYADEAEALENEESKELAEKAIKKSEEVMAKLAELAALTKTDTAKGGDSGDLDTEQKVQEALEESQKKLNEAQTALKQAQQQLAQQGGAKGEEQKKGLEQLLQMIMKLMQGAGGGAQKAANSNAASPSQTTAANQVIKDSYAGTQTVNQVAAENGIKISPAAAAQAASGLQGYTAPTKVDSSLGSM